MEFQKEKWLGSWENFENYIYSERSGMMETWDEVETACQSIPAFKAMFGGGSARDFWKRACVTQTGENSERLGGMQVEDDKNGIRIRFWDTAGHELGAYSYTVIECLEKGLEGKENLLFYASGASEHYPFRYLLAMEPMPDRTKRAAQDLLSHFHFQFASTKDNLLTGDKLVQPGWYTTMCEESSREKDKYKVVRALHRLPV